MTHPVGQLKIGPVRFVLQGEGASTVRYADWAYRDFFGPAVDGADSRDPAMNIRLTQGAPRCPTDPPLFQAGGNWAVWPEGEGWLFCAGFTGRERPRCSCLALRDLRQASLHVDGDPHDAPLRYPLDQVLSYGLLGKCGGILLHAAAVVREGAAMVFAGRSGAGKSTLSGLCAEAGWRVLNDDRVMLYPDPAGVGWRVAGTPWHGSGRFARNETAPLRGVFLLLQDTENRVEPLQADEARRSLLPVASVAWFIDQWAQAGLDALDRLVREVPVRRFGFTRSPEAVEALSLEAVA